MCAWFGVGRVFYTHTHTHVRVPKLAGAVFVLHVCVPKCVAKPGRESPWRATESITTTASSVTTTTTATNPNFFSPPSVCVALSLPPRPQQQQPLCVLHVERQMIALQVCVCRELGERANEGIVIHR